MSDKAYTREQREAVERSLADVAKQAVRGRDSQWAVVISPVQARAIADAARRYLALTAPGGDRPSIVCLCGSTRFPDAWKAAHREESLAGRIVLSVGVMVDAGDSPIREDGPQKRSLDELHLRKIDLADEVLVLNVGGYVGASTAREIAYAEANGKPIRWLEPPEADDKPAEGPGGEVK